MNNFIEISADNYAKLYWNSNTYGCARISYKRGSKDIKQKILDILIKNAEACRNLVPEDAARSAQDIINETYEDLISIISNL